MRYCPFSLQMHCKVWLHSNLCFLVSFIVAKWPYFYAVDFVQSLLLTLLRHWVAFMYWRGFKLLNPSCWHDVCVALWWLADTSGMWYQLPNPSVSFKFHTATTTTLSDLKQIITCRFWLGTLFPETGLI